jgi:hypothetical protein
MTKDMNSTRRRFLQASALLAAPVAAALPSRAMAEDGTHARLARLEDENSIRKLQRDWLQRVNGAGVERSAETLGPQAARSLDGAVSRILLEDAGDPDAIELAEDGMTAVGRYPCLVETECTLEQDCTFARMAHAQGHGTVTGRKRHLLAVTYAKRKDGWTIDAVEFANI